MITAFGQIDALKKALTALEMLNQRIAKQDILILPELRPRLFAGEDGSGMVYSAFLANNGFRLTVELRIGFKWPGQIVEVAARLAPDLSPLSERADAQCEGVLRYDAAQGVFTSEMVLNPAASIPQWLSGIMPPGKPAGKNAIFADKFYETAEHMAEKLR